MQDVHDGASHDAEARLKDEITSSLSAWSDDYGLVRLDLAWTVTQTLLKHVQREQPLDVYLEFTEKLTAILSEEAQQIHAIVGEDVRRRAH